MKGYETVSFAVLVIALLLVAVMDPSSSGVLGRYAMMSAGRRIICSSKRDNSFVPKKDPVRRRRGNRLSRPAEGQDTNSVTGYLFPSSGDASDDPSSFWIRNACHDGFLVVKAGNRVLAQHEGLDKYDPEVRFVKESCVEYGNHGLSDEIMTRLYSPTHDRYICFNHRGKVRAMKPRKAQRMAHLCAFYERPLPDPAMTTSGGRKDSGVYINLQSAHDRKWLLGFGPNTRRHRGGDAAGRGMVYTRGGFRATLPRKMGQRRPPRGRRKCDFQFATGRYATHDEEGSLRAEWRGLFEHIEHFGAPREREEVVQSPVTKTAANLKLKENIPPYVETSTEISSSSDEKGGADGAPSELPSRPKAKVRSRKLSKLVKKYRKLKYGRYGHKKRLPSGASYLYLHNRRRKVPAKKPPSTPPPPSL